MYCHPWRLVSPQKSLNSFLFVILWNIYAKYFVGKFTFYQMPSSISDCQYVSGETISIFRCNGAWERSYFAHEQYLQASLKTLNPVSCFKNIKVAYPWDYYPCDRFNRQSVRVIELNMSVKLNGMIKTQAYNFFCIGLALHMATHFMAMLTPRLNEKTDSGKTHLQDLARWLRTSQRVDIQKISQFYWGLFEKTRFLCFYIIKSMARKGYFGPKSDFKGSKIPPRGASSTWNMYYYMWDTCTSHFGPKKFDRVGRGGQGRSKYGTFGSLQWEMCTNALLIN